MTKHDNWSAEGDQSSELSPCLVHLCLSAKHPAMGRFCIVYRGKTSRARCRGFEGLNVSNNRHKAVAVNVAREVSRFVKDCSWFGVGQELSLLESRASRVASKQR